VRDRQRGDDPAQTGGRKALLTSLTLAGGLAFGTLCTLAAARVAIDAIQASGGERILYAVVAVFFYLLAALLIVGTVGRAVRPFPAFGGPGPDTYRLPDLDTEDAYRICIEFIVDRPARGAIGCSGLFHGS
jgi:hypothetical protein